MKKNDPEVTQSVLSNILDERFDTFEKKVDKKFEKFGREVDGKAKGYRDDVLNKLDEVMGELEQIREDQSFITGDIKDHEKRIIKLEQSSQPR